MAAAQRYTTEQIVAKLREIEKLQAQGVSIPASCKKLGISDQTFYRWRLKYGALKEDELRHIDRSAGTSVRLDARPRRDDLPRAAAAQGYLDDLVYARSWRQSRRRELRQSSLHLDTGWLLCCAFRLSDESSANLSVAGALGYTDHQLRHVSALLHR